MPTEPDEGYLDDEFAKFRAARMKKGSSPLEPHASQATQTPPRTTRPPPPPLPTREAHVAPPARMAERGGSDAQVAGAPGPIESDERRSRARPATDEHPTGAGRRLEVIEEPAPGDDFERFRAQRLRETGKLQKLPEPVAELPREPTTPPAPDADAATRPTVKLAEAPEDGLFFGTSTTERHHIRAHAKEARVEGEVPPKGDEAA
jgi:hypothetical protein